MDGCDTEVNSNKTEDKTIFTKIIGEMKNTFNRAGEGQISGDDDSLGGGLEENTDTELKPEEIIEVVHNNVDNNEVIADPVMEVEEIEEAEPTVIVEELKEVPVPSKETKEKPRIVVCFRKSGRKNENSNKRSRNKVQEETVLKRSARRRKSNDCESVLQSAIARKEKSYNESNKPQRLTRQLKLTPKILENLEQSAGKVKFQSTLPKSIDKQRVPDKVDGKRTKINSDKNRKVKKLKTSHFIEKDSDSDQNQEDCDVPPEIETKDDKSFRRSQRISASRSRDDTQYNHEQTPEASLADQEFNYPADPEWSSVGAELIASKQCLCVKESNIYLESNGKEIFCQAVDSVGEKLVGCNNVVDVKTTAMSRSSFRVPYSVLCTVHTNRMLRHNRCPTCGVFCTQGKFVECENGHHYHRNCQISIGKVRCCPHCSALTPNNDVFITMYSSRRPVFLTKQRASYPPAKMSFVGKYVTSSDSPLLPHDLDFPIAPNGYENNFNVESVLTAIRTNDYEKLAQILGSKSFNLTHPFPEDDTILHYCAKNGHVIPLHMFVTMGMELDVLDKDQNTPLMVAILAHKNNIVKYLIKAGSSITFKGMDGMTALHLAAQCGNLEACEMLLQSSHSKKDYVNICDDGGWTALVWACEHTHSEVVQYLLSKAADPSLRDLKQNVALHWAAFSGSQDCIEFLINSGATMNEVNAEGDTPLHIAARQDKYDAVVLLVLRGSDASAVNKLGETPLDCSDDGGDCYKMILLNIKLQSFAGNQKLNVILSNDISNGRELNPVQCINTIDDGLRPTDYTYVNDYCLTSDIEIDKKITSLHCCTCEDDCNKSSDCSCSQNSMNSYDEDGRLLPNFNFLDPPLIFECNQMCSCNSITCTNRVVQRGLLSRFQLFRTDSKGWGIKSLTLIPRGTFVCEYIGEVISDVEADQRADDSYLFDLDERETETYCIDAKKYGNFSRFLNHSCDANLTPIKVFTDHQDLRFPRVAFFSNREIIPDEELCFDYGLKYWIVKGKYFTCECKCVNCRYSSETLQETIDSYREQLQDLEELEKD